MSKTTTDYNKRAIKSIIKMMEETKTSGRPSVTLGKADIQIVMPLLKKAIGE